MTGLEETRTGETAVALVSDARPAGPWLGYWLKLLCLVLLGYALGGKGIAYIGVPPLFIGEAVLVLGLIGFVLRGCWQQVLIAPQVWLLLALGGWGFLRTYPYFGEYKADALRDAAIWGYSAFAILVFSYLLAEPTRLVALVRAYRYLPPLLLTIVPVLWTVTRIFPRPTMPRWPWADVPVLDTKGGDIMVHVAGILAYWTFGWAGRVRAIWVLPMTACVVLVGTYDRSGLLSFLAVFGLCLFFRPRDAMLWRLIAIGVCGVALLAATDIHVKIPGREREVSFDQLVANLTSTVGSSSAGDLDATKEWRLEWWSDITDYTIRGRYFWTGKGFGINLATDDGYQVEEDDALRNPHNGHLTMLARAGVPGLVLWLLVQLSWAAGVGWAYLEGRRRGERGWPELFLFLLAYWLAFMINASFDVYLEGPMGGIWYWTLYGVGLAAVAIHGYQPDALGNMEREGRP